MAIELLTAPPAAGKTSWCVDLVRRAARDLAQSPYVVVPGALQAAEWQRRLAGDGAGTLGVRVATFRRLYADCLARAGRPYALVPDTVQYRLLRILLDRVPLEVLGALADRPGLVSSLQDVIGDLRASLVDAAAFREGVLAIDGAPRLRDVAALYAAYEDYLALHGWTDDHGLGWLARDTLSGPAPWPLVVADGFEDLTPLETDILRRLGEGGAQVVVTLTVPPAGAARLLGERPAERLADLARRLEVTPQPLAPLEGGVPAALDALRHGLFVEVPRPAPDPDGALALVEAPDRFGEVRAALRWCKARLAEAPDQPSALGIVVRRLDPYRASLAEVAAEYGLPVRIAGGLPLAGNPAVGALLGLLRAVTPPPRAPGEPSLPRRAVVEAWRSPYFSWSCATTASDPTPVGIRPEDARVLDQAARAGRAIRGLAQWREALDLWVQRGGQAPPDDEDALPEDDGRGGPLGCPPEVLRARFERFVARLTPPAAHTYRQYVRWVEDLIGPDPLSTGGRRPAPPDTYSLRMVERIRDGACGEEDAADEDLAALARLKDVLRGLVWAEEALGIDPSLDYPRFLQEVVGAVEAERYEVPSRGDLAAITVAEVHAAAGVGYGALAVLGLAEGEFPAPRRDDPLLTDADRRALRAHDPALALPPLLESRETEAFCRLVASARERLLLTRPRLAETGATWAPSPFWEEVLRQVAVRPRTLTSDAAPDLREVCSWPELLSALASRGETDLLEGRLPAWRPGAGPAQELLSAEWAARAVLAARVRRALGPYDGDLAAAADVVAARFPAERPWSASRLESYRSCPLAFFVGSVLGLEPRLEPAEGPDARQLGNLYHRILEQVYRACPDDDGAGACTALLAALPEVARRVLDAAPAEEGFRETPWWLHTRAEIVEHVRLTILALAEHADRYRPLAFEAGFFGAQALQIEVDGVRLAVHGLIDRVDVDAEGRLRIIDYKTAGPDAFKQAALEQGDKLQLPLYALAARDALGLGEPADGFYWHVRAAAPSPARLSRCEGGAEGIMEAAARVAAEVAEGVAAGCFPPRPPAEGCPPYCPAAGFCWHLRPRRG